MWSCEELCTYFDECIDDWNEEFDDVFKKEHHLASEDQYRKFIKEKFTKLVDGYNKSCPDEIDIVFGIENTFCIYAYLKNDKENKIFYDNWCYGEENGEDKKLFTINAIASTIKAVLLPLPKNVKYSIKCIKNRINFKGD